MKKSMRSSLRIIAIAVPFAAVVFAAVGADRKTVQSEKATFSVVTIVDGLQNPWSVAWLPDGRMLVTERAGRLRIVSKDLKLDPKPVEGLPKIVVGGQG